jgi:hypothetical protein
MYAGRWVSGHNRCHATTAGGGIQPPTYAVRRCYRRPARHAVDAVSALRRQANGDIVVYASFQLVHTLMEHDLVD